MLFTIHKLTQVIITLFLCWFLLPDTESCPLTTTPFFNTGKEMYYTHSFIIKAKPYSHQCSIQQTPSNYYKGPLTTFTLSQKLITYQKANTSDRLLIFHLLYRQANVSAPSPMPVNGVLSKNNQVCHSDNQYVCKQSFKESSPHIF